MTMFADNNMIDNAVSVNSNIQRIITDSVTPFQFSTTYVYILRYCWVNFTFSRKLFYSDNVFVRNFRIFNRQL